MGCYTKGETKSSAAQAGKCSHVYTQTYFSTQTNSCARPLGRSGLVRPGLHQRISLFLLLSLHTPPLLCGHLRFPFFVFPFFFAMQSNANFFRMFSWASVYSANESSPPPSSPLRRLSPNNALLDDNTRGRQQHSTRQRCGFTRTPHA